MSAAARLLYVVVFTAVIYALTFLLHLWRTL